MSPVEDVRQLARLRRYAGSLPLSSDVAYCCRRLAFGVGTADVLVKDGRAWYAGVVHCKDVWACPECSYKASQRRAKALRHMVTSAMSLGYRVLLVTFTFSHHKGDRLAGLRSSFSAALERMRSGRRWNDMRSRYGLVGFVRGQEVTHGANGWHPHCHELWVCSGDADVSQLREDVQAAYLAALAKVGLSASSGVGIDVREADADITKYIAKFGRPPRWDAAKEVANGRRKSGRKGETPWQLLARAADGDGDARSLFIEYAQSYRGVRQLYVSRGLVEVLKLGSSFADVEALDDALPDEVAGAVVAVSLTQVELNCLFFLGLEGELLAFALDHPPDECRAFVEAAHRRVKPYDFDGEVAA